MRKPVFTIVIDGQTRRFKTLQGALRAAADIFTKTGVVVGVQRVPR